MLTDLVYMNSISRRVPYITRRCKVKLFKCKLLCTTRSNRKPHQRAKLWPVLMLGFVLNVSFVFLLVADTWGQPVNSSQSTDSSASLKGRSQKNESKKQSPRKRVEALILELKLDLEKKPNDPSLLMKLAQALIKLGEYQHAQTHLQNLVNHHPKDEDAHYMLAFTYRKLKQFKEAVAEYNLFLNLAKGSKRLSGVFGLAKTLDLTGDPKGAARLYQEFVDQETRPSQQRWVEEAKSSLLRLKASEVVLIDTDVEEDSPTSSEVVPNETLGSNKTLSESLAHADLLFAQGEYQRSGQIYQELGQREIPNEIKKQVLYSAAVSEYLAQHYKKAKQLSEHTLLLTDPQKANLLKGLAILSHVQQKEAEAQKQSSTLSEDDLLVQVKLALKEGRFHNTLNMIDDHIKAQRSPKDKKPFIISPLLLHAKSRAHIGLSQYAEAYQALQLAAKGLKSVQILTDLATTAQKLKQNKKAIQYYQSLKLELSSSKYQQDSKFARQVDAQLKLLQGL